MGGVRRTLSTFAKELYTFAKDLDRKIDNLDQRYTMLKDDATQARIRRLVNALPEELLAEILFHASGDFKSITELSGVCRRFRSAALSTPKIWASCKLRSQMDPEVIKAIVKRSGAIPLKASINYMTYESRIKCKPGPPSSVKEILLSSSRISELNWYLDESYMSYLNQCNEYLQLSGGFPILQTLHLLLSDQFDLWEMPHLRELTAMFVPQPMIGINLIKFTLCYDELHLGRTMDFLSSCNKLQDLRLEMTYDYSTDFVDEKSVDSLHPVSLPSLVSLAIIIMHNRDDASPRIVDNFLALIHPTSISKLELKVKYGDVTCENPGAMRLLRSKIIRFIQDNP